MEHWWGKPEEGEEEHADGEARSVDWARLSMWADREERSSGHHLWLRPNSQLWEGDLFSHPNPAHLSKHATIAM